MRISPANYVHSTFALYKISLVIIFWADFISSTFSPMNLRPIFYYNPSQFNCFQSFISPLITNPHFKWGLKNAPKGSVTARLKGACRKHLLLAAARKRPPHDLLSGILLTVPVYTFLWRPLLHFLPSPHNILLPKMLYSIYFVPPDACHISSAYSFLSDIP